MTCRECSAYQTWLYNGNDSEYGELFAFGECVPDSIAYCVTIGKVVDLDAEPEDNGCGGDR